MFVFDLVPIDNGLVFEDDLVLLRLLDGLLYIILRQAGYGSYLFNARARIFFQYFQNILQHKLAPEFISSE
jgi:hypothetical protein